MNTSAGAPHENAFEERRIMVENHQSRPAVSAAHSIGRGTPEDYVFKFLWALMKQLI
jgi:hypothetical protein